MCFLRLSPVSLEQSRASSPGSVERASLSLARTPAPYDPQCRKATSVHESHLNCPTRWSQTLAEPGCVPSRAVLGTGRRVRVSSLTQHEVSVLECDCGKDQSAYPGGSLTPSPEGRGRPSPRGPPGRQLGTSPPSFLPPLEGTRASGLCQEALPGGRGSPDKGSETPRPGQRHLLPSHGQRGRRR